MNKQRLLELADHLDSLPRKRFNMASFYTRWVKRDGTKWEVGFLSGRDDFDEDETIRPTDVTKVLEGSCNTSACIAGWAVALHPRAGAKDTHGRWARSWFDGERYFNYDVAEHAASILGLESADAHRLFFQDMGMTPKQAAKKIRKAVKLGYVPEGNDD